MPPLDQVPHEDASQIAGIAGITALACQDPSAGVVGGLAPLDASLPVLIDSVKAQGFEGLTAKRLDSRYESGQRSGAWLKMRVNQGQEFVIGGYTRGSSTFDALIFGYYHGGLRAAGARGADRPPVFSSRGV